MITAVRALSIGTALLTAAVVLPFQAWPTNGSTSDSPPAALELARGTFTPPGQDARILSAGQYCEMVTTRWGWTSCDGIDAVILDPADGTAATVIETAHSAGHVSLDAWSDDTVAQLTGEIERQIRATAAAQSETLGIPVRFEGWRVAPTLDRRAAMVFYAVDMSFDGQTTTNVSATLFDRRGFVQMGITPRDADLTADDVMAVVRANAGAYRTSTSESHGAVQPDDARIADDI